jgi:hypothetical protein
MAFWSKGDMQRRDAMRRLGLFVVLVISPAIALAEMPFGTTIKVVADAWLARKSGPGFGAAMTMVETAGLSTPFTHVGDHGDRPVHRTPLFSG